MKLSKRLEAIASFIPDSGGVIDVGCNHAYICIFIALKGKERKIIGTDCNPLSLKEAYCEIAKRNLENKISILVTNGLDNVSLEENDTVIISGLGTRTIKEILNNQVLDNINHIIIQSNNYLYELRRYMSLNDFFIKNELVVKESNKFYVVIDFYRSNKKIKYNEFELKYGPFSSFNKNYLINELKILKKNLKKVENFDNKKCEKIKLDIISIEKQLEKIS